MEVGEKKKHPVALWSERKPICEMRNIKKKKKNTFLPGMKKKKISK